MMMMVEHAMMGAGLRQSQGESSRHAVDVPELWPRRKNLKSAPAELIRSPAGKGICAQAFLERTCMGATPTSSAVCNVHNAVQFSKPRCNAYAVQCGAVQRDEVQ